MRNYSRLLGAAALLMALSATNPASAQKSQDTLRLAINNPYNILSTYDLSVDEAAVFSRDVYDYLLKYDEHNQKFVPSLAKSWTRVNPQTLEFDLRDDIKWHNGDKFEAGDVKTTVEYIIDPKSKITFQNRYNWIERIEVISPTKLRVHAKEPTGTDLMLLAYRIPIYNGKLMDKMADKQDYGRLNPVGTGAYKVNSIDTNKGIVVERAEGYNTMPAYKSAPIKRIHGIPMPDKQTQSAQMMVGGVELIRAVPPDLAKALTEGNPNIKLTYVAAPSLIYMALDAQGIAGNKALADPRVRKAIFMGIDRELIIKNIVPGGDIAERTNGDCFKQTIACKYTTSPPKYDPEGARKLLAEAGYKDGLDINYVVFAPYKDVAEAISGNLLKIGVRMSIQPADISLYRRLQGDGKLQAWTSVAPSGTFPDAGSLLSTLYTGPAMKYYNDGTIADAMDKGEKEFDFSKRADIYQKAFDRINEMHYN
ncbi:MAG: hypothetical protein K0Q70_1168, partial [Rhodospirillales bacterium]|nr:hypothetical protein [Rhodospirillales bacterium]